MAGQSRSSIRQIMLQPEQLPADQHPAIVYLSSIAQGSRRTQQTALENIAYLLTNGKADMMTLAWHHLKYQHTNAVRMRLLDDGVYSAATINRHLSALRGVLKQAWKLGLMKVEAYSAAAAIENIKSEPLPSGRMLQPEEVKALLQVCGLHNRETGIRDAALISLLYITGMRRFEAAKLQVGDFDTLTGQITIHDGKGRKSRTSYVDGNAKAHLMNWLRLRGVSRPGALFLTVDSRGNITDKQLGDQSIYDMLVRRGKQAGLEHFSPHDLRRSAISEMLDRDVDISTVAKVVGHSSLDTTKRYDRRDEEGKRAVTKVFDVPI